MFLSNRHQLIFFSGQTLAGQSANSHGPESEATHRIHVSKIDNNQRTFQRLLEQCHCREKLSFIVKPNQREAAFVASNVWVPGQGGLGDPDEHLLNPPIWKRTWDGLPQSTMCCTTVCPHWHVVMACPCGAPRPLEQKYIAVSLVQRPTQLISVFVQRYFKDIAGKYPAQHAGNISLSWTDKTIL